jgi:hypothetical protein
LSASKLALRRTLNAALIFGWQTERSESYTKGVAGAILLALTAGRSPPQTARASRKHEVKLGSAGLELEGFFKNAASLLYEGTDL